MKPLLKSLRARNRYILVQITPVCTKEDFSQALTQSIHALVGQVGYAKAMPKIEKFTNNHAVIQTTTSGTDIIKASLLLIKQIKNQPTTTQSIKVTGLLNRLEEKCKA